MRYVKEVVCRYCSRTCLLCLDMVSGKENAHIAEKDIEYRCHELCK